MTWPEYYRGRVRNPRSLARYREKYTPFFELIEQEEPRVLIEAGAGIGSCSYCLFERGVGEEFHLWDNSQEMLNLARQNIGPVMGNVCHFTLTDITGPPLRGEHELADLAFSHGVLEHMRDEDIRRTILRLEQAAGTQLHLVPSSKYTEKSFGDERLMTMEEWYGICSPDEIVELNQGLDLVLVFDGFTRGSS